MKYTTLLLILTALGAACSKSATGPTIKDPFVVTRVVNDLDTSYALYVRYPSDTVTSFQGVIDLQDSLGRFGYRCTSFSSIADTTRLYLVTFRSNSGVSSGNFNAGDSTTMHTTGLINPFIGQAPHGDVAADPIRWLWLLSVDSLVPDTAQYALALQSPGDPKLCRF